MVIYRDVSDNPYRHVQATKSKQTEIRHRIDWYVLGYVFEELSFGVGRCLPIVTASYMLPYLNNKHNSLKILSDIVADTGNANIH